MANETLGGIAWTVDADTSKAVKSVGDLDRTADKAEKSLSDLDKKAAGAKKSVDQLGSSMAKVTPVAEGVSTSMANMGRSAGQAGIQLQQFIGQIQGGQSAMLALSQQSADLGFVLGAPLLGAVIGIGASIAGMFVASMGDGKTATQRLDEAVERLKATLTLTSEGVVEYSDKMKMLASVSNSLATSNLQLAMDDQLIILKEKAKEAQKSIEDLQSKAASFWGTPGADFDAFAKSLVGVNDVTPTVRKSILALKQELIRMSRATKDSDIEGMLFNIEQALDGVKVNGQFATSAAKNLGRGVTQAAQAFLEGQMTLEGLQDAIKDGENLDPIVNADDIKAVNEMVKALKEEAKAISETTRQTALRRAVDLGANDEQLKQINASFDALEAAEAKRQAEMEAKRKSRRTRQDPNEKYQQVADRLSVQAIKLQSESLALEKALTLEKAAREGVSEAIRKQISDSYDLRIANAKEAEAARAAAKAQREADKKDAKESRELAEKNRAKDLAQGIVNRGTTNSPELLKLQNERSQLETVRDQMLDEAELFQAALNQIEEDGAKARMDIAAMSMGSFSSTFDELANVLKKSEGEQSSAFKAMFALSKGFAIAQAGLNLSKAVMDAFSWGGLTPVEKFASAAAVAAAGAGFVSAIAGASYSGREHGGSVMANQVYEVGEKNKPEMLMIPGNNGKVFSNSEVKSMMGGGGGGGAPIINNYAAGAGYEVQYRRDEVTKRDVFDIVQSEMTNPNSKGRRGMQQNSNLHGVLNGGRRR